MTSGPTQPPPRPPTDGRRWVWIALMVVLLYPLWAWLLGEQAFREISYSAFRAHLAQGAVDRLRLEEGRIRGELTLPPEQEEVEPADEGAEPAEPKAVLFQTVRVEDPELVADLEAAGVEYTGARPSAFTGFLYTWALPMGVMLLVLVWIFRSAARGAGTQAMGFGKSRARLVPETGTGVNFADVAGCDEAKESLREMVEFLRNPGRFTALGAHIPKGVLLLGPPGTGKTLLARAVAGEAEVPFFSITGSDFVEMFVGVGAARVRDLFVQAKQRAPCIVFIDEVDAVGRQRGVSMGVVNDEREQTLNQLLSEMDGFEANSGVILIAATNRPEILDRALLRPGRFDRQVVLDAPDRVGREAILRVHTRDKPLADDVDLGRIAQGTPGMSGADLANALNEAALWAARHGRAAVSHADIEEAIERVLAGPERRSRRLGPEEKRRVAYHESGHAVVAAWSENADPVKRISIVPRGRAALGYTMQLPEEEQFLRTRPQLLDDLKVRLGGRAAEELVIGEVSTGAQDDLQTATAIARQMVCLFGMSERLGLASCARPDEGRFLRGGELTLQRDCSEATSREIDEEVKALLAEALESAKSILTSHRPELDAVASALLEHETLDREAFERLAGRVPEKQGSAVVPRFPSSSGSPSGITERSSR